MCVNIYYWNNFLLRANLITLITKEMCNGDTVTNVLFAVKRFFFYQILITGFFSHIILTRDISHWEVLNGNKLAEAVNNAVDNGCSIIRGYERNASLPGRLNESKI